MRLHTVDFNTTAGPPWDCTPLNSPMIYTALTIALPTLAVALGLTATATGLCLLLPTPRRPKNNGTAQPSTHT